MAPRLKEPFIRKHIHSWRCSGIEIGTTKHTVDRVCQDCGLEQEGRVPVALFDATPRSLIHLVDVEWREPD